MLRDHNIFQRIPCARRAHDWKALETCGQDLLAKDRESIYARLILGESLEKVGEIEKAVAFYEEALKIDAGQERDVRFHHFLQRLDIIYNRQKRYEDCLRVCLYYTHRHPSSEDAWKRLKRAARHNGRRILVQQSEDEIEHIRAIGEAARKAKETRLRRFSELYDLELKKLSHESPNDSFDEREPPPPNGASEDEWAMWLERNTDGARLQAETAAGLSATDALHWEEIDRRLGERRPMTAQARLEVLSSAMKRLPECVHGGFITLTDRTDRDNWVQLTDRHCNIPRRDWPLAAPDVQTGLTKLKNLGFISADGQDASVDTLLCHTGMAPEALAELVLQVFTALGSSPDFELVVEFEDM